MSVINVSNHTAGSLYKTMNQGGVEMRSNRLSRRYLPSNRAREADQLSASEQRYVSRLKTASASLSTAVKRMSAGGHKLSDSDSDTLKDLISSYNDLYIETIFNSNDTRAVNLAYRLLSISVTYSDSLSDVGVEFDQFGIMSVDNERLEEAAENGKLGQFLSGTSEDSHGFANRLTKLADNVTYNTTNFVSRSAFGSNLTENFAYSSEGDVIQYTYFSTGLIFDYSF